MVSSPMGTERTAWHVLFAALITERAPPDVEVIVEHVLTQEPQKSDLLLIRRSVLERHDERARVFRRLWPLLSSETLVEFKSRARPARRGDWIRLLGYAAQHHTKQLARIERASELTLVLVVPTLTSIVREEAHSLGWLLEDLGDGYHRVHGSEYPGFLVVLADVAEAERDDLLRWFASARLENSESAWWIMSHSTAKPNDRLNIEELEGFDELLRTFLARIPPEKRRADLSAEESVLLLADEMLRRLSPEFIAALPANVQDEIRRRLSH